MTYHDYFNPKNARCQEPYRNDNRLLTLCSHKLFGAPRAKRRSVVDLGGIVIQSDDVGQDFHVGKIAAVDQIHFAQHAQVLDGKRGDLAFLQFIHTGALRQDGNAQLLSDQILYGCNVVDLKGDIEGIDALVDSRQCRLEKLSRAGGRRIICSLFSSFSVTIVREASLW